MVFLTFRLGIGSSDTMKPLATFASEFSISLRPTGAFGLLCLVSSMVSLAADTVHIQSLSKSNPLFPPAETGGGVSGGGRLSADGQRVFFLSDAPGLVPGQPLGHVLQLFGRSLPNGAPVLISQSADGHGGSSGSVRDYDISADGSLVVWSSSSTNLVPGAIPGVADVYMRDFVANTLVRISSNGQGQAGSGDSGNPILSKDGRFILFESRADNLTALDTQHIRNVFLRTRNSATNLLISAAADGSPASGDSAAVQMSAQGETVIFRSTATNLAPATSATPTDLYLFRPALGELTQVTVPVKQTNSSPTTLLSSSVVLSPDGRYLAFHLRNPLGIKPTSAVGVWWFDLAANTNALISQNLQVAGREVDNSGPVMTLDGRTVAFTAISDRTGTNQVMVWNADSGLHHLDDLLVTVPPGFSEPISSSDPVLSPDGRNLLFQTFAAVPAAGVTNSGNYRLYLRDLVTGATSTANPTVQPRFDAVFPEFSSDGSSILIQTQDPVPGHSDLNQQMDLLTVDLDWKPTALVSSTPSPSGPSTAWGMSSLDRYNLSDDGQVAAFSSTSVDLLSNAGDGFPKIFSFTESLGDPQLASGSTNPPTKGYPVRSPRISGDGRYVAFLSENPGLAPGVQGTGATIYVRDLIHQTTVVASSVGGLFGNIPGLSLTGPPAISANGRFVAFQSTVIGRNSQMFLRDSQTSNTIWLTSPTLGFSTSLPLALEPGPEMSADGSTVAFLGQPTATSLFLYTTSPAKLSLVDIGGNLRPFSISLSASGERGAFPVGYWYNSQILGVLWHDNRTGSNNWAATGTRLTDQFTDIHISANGQRIVFASNFTPPGSTATNTFSQIFVFDIPTATLTQISMPIGGGTADGPSRSPAISGDGRWVVFRTDASNLVPYVHGSPGQIWLRDLNTGLMALVSHRLTDGQPADLPSSEPQISADGSTVLFTSFADDLVAFDNNGTGDVFLATVPDPSTFDGNGNGLPDAWELKYFGNLNQTASGDFDGDGISNLDEYQSGSDPRDPHSFLRSAGAYITAQDQFQVTFQSFIGIIYQLLESKTANGGSFSPVGSSVVGTGGSLTLSIPLSDSQGFVRLSAHR